ncbi:MAG: hypothetical protein QXR45_11870 [Candidatus Bathyarchaeia archaeon]
MENKSTIIFDGPPASGKTTLSRILAQRFHCPYMHYKALGFINIISTAILRLIRRYSITQVKPIRTKEDPVLLLEPRLLKRMRWIIFLVELPYKMFQVMMLGILSIICSYLVIDEFFTLRAANYINVYFHGGLSKRQAELLMRIDLALLRTLAKHRGILYIYIDRPVEELKNLWHKREHDKEYSEEYLAIVRLIWKMYQAQISDFAQIQQITR